MRRLLFGCVLLLNTLACIVEAPSASGNLASRSRPLKNAAPLRLNNGANLGGKLMLQGLTIEPGTVLAGESFKVVAEFKVLEKTQIDYMVFVHVEDANGSAERMNADHAPTHGRLPYPTTSWQPGETVRDEFTVFVPPGRTGKLNLYMGLWDPKTDERLPLQNPEAVRHDGNNRIFVATVPLS